jgi:signal transduction histidine kinase
MHAGDDIDLGAALRALADSVPRLRLVVSAPEEMPVGGTEQANAVLRCVQEITTNTLKHSDAANLWITIRSCRGRLEIAARDDGRRPLIRHSGSGLQTMRRRFEELGGGVDVEPESEGGFAVRAWLPARPEAAL